MMMIEHKSCMQIEENKRLILSMQLYVKNETCLFWCDVVTLQG